MNLWLVLSSLLLGLFIGYLGFFPEEFQFAIDFITKSGLMVLLLAMGAKIGREERVLKHIDQIGFQAFSIALGSILGGIILVKFLSYFVAFVSIDENIEVSISEETRGRTTLLIVGSVAIGVLLGLFFLPEGSALYIDPIITYSLGVLLLGIGIDLGMSKKVVKNASFGIGVILLPFFVAIGSVVGAISVGVLLEIPLNEAAAVGAGFGWYSFSGVFLAELHSVELGLLAFLSNIFRELLAILLCPFVAKYLGKPVSIAPGGATTMDVTLPVVKESAGDAYVVPAFVSGAVLMGLTPILVPLLIGL